MIETGNGRYMSEEDVIEFLMNEGMTKEQAIMALAHPTFPEPAFYVKDEELN
jgi:hypothetical protein